MKKKILNTIKYVAILAIGIGLLMMALNKLDLDEAMNEIGNANFFWISLSIVASLASFFSRAIRWNMLIESFHKKPTLMSTSTALMMGYLANLAFPRLGEVTRCGTLARTDKVPFDKLFGTVIFERLLDVICLLICIILTAFINYGFFMNFVNEYISPKVQLFLHSPVTASIVVIVFLALVWLTIRFAKSSKSSGKFTKLIKGFGEGFTAVMKMKSPFWFIFHTVFIWVMYFYMSYWCFKSLEATHNLDWHAGMLILVAGALGMSAPVNGGIGTYHAAVIGALMLYNVESQHATVFAVLMHGLSTMIVIILGGLSFLYLFLKERNANTKQS